MCACVCARVIECGHVLSNRRYLNAYGTFQDAHTLLTVNRRNKEKTITAEKFVIATGGTPSFPLPCVTISRFHPICTCQA